MQRDRAIRSVSRRCRRTMPAYPACPPAHCHRHRRRSGPHPPARPACSDRGWRRRRRAGSAFAAGIIAAHQALELGESRRPCSVTRSALAQRGRRCSAPCVRIGALVGTIPLFDQPARQLGHAVDLVGHGAQLLVEGDVRELLGLVLEPRLIVLLPEEARIGQAGGEDLARCPRRWSRRRRSRRCSAVQTKARREPAVPCRAERNISGLSGAVSWITSGGTSRNARVEMAEQRHRPFGEAGILRRRSPASCTSTRFSACASSVAPRPR